MEMEFFVAAGRGRASGTSTGSTSGGAGTSTSACARATCACAPHDADELSHYSSGTSDLEYLFPIGWSELEGIANRGDFDLTRARRALGHEARVDRPRGALRPARDRARRRRRPRRARVPRRRLRRGGGGASDRGRCSGSTRASRRSRSAVLPLVGKDAGLVEQGARALYEELRRVMPAEYDDSASIGKRYRRQDEIGTPWALTIDHQTLEDGTVTIRDRDTLAQERIPIDGRARAPARPPRAALAAARLGRWAGTSSRSRARRCAATRSATRATRPLFVWTPPTTTPTRPPLPVALRAPRDDRPGARLVQRLAVREEPSRARSTRAGVEAIVVLVDGFTVARRLAVHRLAGDRRATGRTSARTSSRSSTRASARFPTPRTAASRASRRAGSARWSGAMLRPDLFGGVRDARGRRALRGLARAASSRPPRRRCGTSTRAPSSASGRTSAPAAPCSRTAPTPCS